MLSQTDVIKLANSTYDQLGLLYERKLLTDVYIHAFPYLQKRVSNIKDENEVIRAVLHIYGYIDDTIERVLELTKQENIKIQCDKGCYYCCYQKVQISTPSAIVIKTHTESILPLQNKCEFLKNNECSIYNIRPLACRYWHCVNDSKQCKDYYFNGIKQKNNQIEVIIGIGWMIENLMNHAFEMGGYDMTRKPFDCINTLDIEKWLHLKVYS